MKITYAIQGVTETGEVLWRIGMGTARIVGLELHVWRTNSAAAHQKFELTDEQINPRESE